MLFFLNYNCLGLQSPKKYTDRMTPGMSAFKSKNTLEVVSL